MARSKRNSETDARASFRLKVETMESWVRAGGPPTGLEWPVGPVALRRWTDVELKLNAWSSPNVASPEGPHADLRERYNLALKSLKSLRQRNGKGRQLKENDWRESENAALIEQNLYLRTSLRQTEDKLTRTEQLLALSVEREAALTSSLATVKPLRSIRGNERRDAD